MMKRLLCYRHHCQQLNRLAGHDLYLANEWQVVPPEECELCREGQAMIDYTQVFNSARVEAGRKPTDHLITIVFEGMITGCGCSIVRASNGTFTILHNGESCKYGRDGKQRVGDGVRNAVASVWGQPSIIAMTQPWCGLFPHEQEIEQDDGESNERQNHQLSEVSA